jgi:hypothetical protein
VPAGGGAIRLLKVFISGSYVWDFIDCTPVELRGHRTSGRRPWSAMTVRLLYLTFARVCGWLVLPRPQLPGGQVDGARHDQAAPGPADRASQVGDTSALAHLVSALGRSAWCQLARRPCPVPN